MKDIGVAAAVAPALVIKSAVNAPSDASRTGSRLTLPPLVHGRALRRPAALPDGRMLRLLASSFNHQD
jgi:hypothetical protein